jgi:hypothetical protein
MASLFKGLNGGGYMNSQDDDAAAGKAPHAPLIDSLHFQDEHIY